MERAIRTRAGFGALAIAGVFGVSSAFGAGFIDRAGDANNEGLEIGGPGIGDRLVIKDEIAGGPITTVYWTLGGANFDLFETSPGVRAKSTAAPGGALAAVQSAFNTIQASTNFLFLQSADPSRWNNLPGPGGHGLTIDLFFADLDAAFGPGVLGGAFTGDAVGAAAGGTFTASNVDLCLNNKMGVFAPGGAPAGYSPVVKPFVQPYGTFTGTGNSAVLDDIEGTVLHEVMHCLGLQHCDRTIQNFNTNARWTRNYDTAVSGTSVVQARSQIINEDNFFTSGQIRMRDDGNNGPTAVAGEPFSVNANAGASASMNSQAASQGSVVRTITPDDLKGLGYQYQDLVAQANGEALQTTTAAKYAGITIESDWSVGADANGWNDDPSQATRNDLRANAQDLGVLTVAHKKLVGSVAGRVSGAESTTGDVDYYKIQVPGGSTLVIDIDEGVDIGNSCDTLARLLKADGTELTNSDVDMILDPYSREGSLSVEDPAFAFVIAGVGMQTLYIKVESVMFTPTGGGAPFNDEGDYLLVTYIPEPGSLLALGALGGLCLRRARRRR
ncbi:MAG: PEP-CTERM sorting domain-containing protein [Tepidisphaeraceae bacterium]